MSGSAVAGSILAGSLSETRVKATPKVALKKKAPKGKKGKKHWTAEHQMAFQGYNNMGKLPWLDKHRCESFDQDVKNKVLREQGH